MTAIVHVARACALADRDTFYVAAISVFTLTAGAMWLVRYGSFARGLAAIGLAPGG